MTDIFEKEAYAPGEQERLQVQFDKEARDIFDALVEENTDIDGKVNWESAMIILAVKYLTIRYDWMRLRERLTPSARGLSIDAVLSAIDSEPELPGEPPQEMVEAIVQAVRDTDTALLAETLRIVVRLTKQGIRERIVAATSTGNAVK